MTKVHLAVACVAMMVAVTLSGCSDAKDSGGSSGMESVFRAAVPSLEEGALDTSLPDRGWREYCKHRLRQSGFYEGTVGSELTANEWLRLSAEKGLLTAQQNIANKERDNAKGYAWYQVLIHRLENPDGDPDAKSLADRGIVNVYKQMQADIELTPEELTQAKALAAEYVQKYVPRKE